jgi:hypothetical protein
VVFGQLQAPEEPPQFLLLGVFHFEDPAFDAVKADAIDIFAPDVQAFLVELARRLGSIRAHPCVAGLPTR